MSDLGSILEGMRALVYAIWFAVLLAVWIMFAAYFGDRSLVGLANVGTALGPLGSVITFLALVFAFRQNRETADRAHRDKLADAYADWFRIARTELDRAANELLQARLIFQRQADSNESMKGRRHILDGLRIVAGLRIASTAVLLLEDDEQLRKRIEATFATIFRGPMIGIARYPTAVKHHAEVVNRQNALEELYSDVVVRLRGGARPQPTTSEPEPESEPDRAADNESAADPSGPATP